MDHTFWLNDLKKLIGVNRDYLKRHGYGDHDISDLATARPTKNPKRTNRNQLFDLIDNRPNAEIVATAYLVYMGEAALQAFEQGDMDVVIELMRYVGFHEAVAQLFVNDPGHSADLALKHNHYLAIATGSRKYVNQRIQQLQHANRMRKKKTDDRSPRNAWICAEGKKLLETGTHARFITGMVARRYNIKYQNDNAISDKQVRRILREHKVL